MGVLGNHLEGNNDAKVPPLLTAKPSTCEGLVRVMPSTDEPINTHTGDAMTLIFRGDWTTGSGEALHLYQRHAELTSSTASWRTPLPAKP